MNLDCFKKNGFVKLSVKDTGVNTKNLSKKILNEFLKLNFINYPTLSASSPLKIKNIYEYINYIHRIDTKNKNTRLTSGIYKLLPNLISLNQFVVSDNLLKIIKLLGKNDYQIEQEESKKYKDKKKRLKVGGYTIGTVPLIRIDRPLDKKYKTPWHQDYWFSGISPDSLVFWAPLGYLDEKMGFLEAIPSPQDYKILSIKKYRGGNEPFEPKKKVNENFKLILNCKFGEFFIFKQSLLHKSGRNISNKVRVSLQIRFNKFYKNKEIASSFIPKNTEFVKSMQKKLSS